jgi:hypothetical protein
MFATSFSLSAGSLFRHEPSLNAEVGCRSQALAIDLWLAERGALKSREEMRL